MHRFRVQISTFILISVLFSVAGCNNVASSSKITEPRGELFNAISLGLPLGVLAAKYTPSLPEEAGDSERREKYTQLFQSAVDELDITLDPPPGSLLSAGRGQAQYAAIESYFGQINAQTNNRSRCTKYTAGLSLNSAWLILGYHEIQNLPQEDFLSFKQDFVSRLDQFVGLSAAASFACGEEGNSDFATKLDTFSGQALDWKHQFEQATDDEFASKVVSFGTTLANWLNDLAAVASGLPTP